MEGASWGWGIRLWEDWWGGGVHGEIEMIRGTGMVHRGACWVLGVFVGSGMLIVSMGRLGSMGGSLPQPRTRGYF